MRQHNHLTEKEVREFDIYIQFGMDTPEDRVWEQTEECDECNNIFVVVQEKIADEFFKRHPDLLEEVKRAQETVRKIVEKLRQERCSRGGSR